MRYGIKDAFMAQVEQDCRDRFPTIDYTMEVCQQGIAVVDPDGNEIAFYERALFGEEERIRY
jgi:hypothetical protein